MVMNKRTQLLEVIAALPDELVDQALNYVQMLQNPIQITPGSDRAHFDYGKSPRFYRSTSHCKSCWHDYF